MKTARSLLSLALPLLVGCVLLLTQQVSATHALQHTLADHQQQDKSAAHTHHCDLCALDVQLGSAVHSGSPPLLLAAFGTHHQSLLLPSLLTSPVRVATARGPPASSLSFA
ncbi:MAG TPA: DUF2946 family protein [Gallionellaceae bacterium]|nr:DUF2946 family protein [Gallionellaceae bacterium]